MGQMVTSARCSYTARNKKTIATEELLHIEKIEQAAFAEFVGVAQAIR